MGFCVASCDAFKHWRQVGHRDGHMRLEESKWFQNFLGDHVSSQWHNMAQRAMLLQAESTLLTHSHIVGGSLGPMWLCNTLCWLSKSSGSSKVDTSHR
jgi:hypothetical protein